MNFSESNIAALFGHEAAEDEEIGRLRAYYFKSSIFDQIKTDLPLRVLVGHKGIGKSALFHIAIDEENSEGKLALLIKPDDIVGIGEQEVDFLKMIREWKLGIMEIVSRKALISFGLPFDGIRARINEYGGRIIDYLQETVKSDKVVDLKATQRAVVNQFLKSSRIYVYLDDLDRGWEGRSKDIKKISALLNAVRDIASENNGIYFRISLRSDVFYLVRTSDESTDKIEGSVVWHSWTNHEIMALLVKRIEQFFGRSPEADTLISKSQLILAEYLNPVMVSKFEGQGKWSNIPTYRMLMSLVRKRPRDLVKLCTLAARHAKSRGANLIGTEDFNAIFEEYSQGRLQDTINEYRSELPAIDRLLFGMKPARRNRNANQSYVYSTDALLKKISDIEQTGSFSLANGRKADKKDLAALLFKINFLTARKDEGDSINRRYFEESRYLSQKFADFGFDWEVHPAYRWALQPDNLADIFLQMKPSDTQAR